MAFIRGMFTAMVKGCPACGGRKIRKVKMVDAKKGERFAKQ
jgi:predicted  nucleic acid-binding Zn-ribbon protein